MTEASTETSQHLLLSTSSERYRNAERLSRALRGYMQLDEALIKSRGRTKDKRICQLNAAYKYCIHLETTIRDMCEREGVSVPDDCKLIHVAAQTAANGTLDDAANTNENDEDSIMIDQGSTSYLTPNQQNNWSIHESSTLSSAIASNTTASNVSTGVMTRSRLQRHLQNSFQHAVDASPILGAPATQSETSSDLKELRSRLGGKKRKLETTAEPVADQASLSSVNSSDILEIPSKQKLLANIDLLDLNNNTERGKSSEIENPEKHFNTPSSVSSCDSSDLISAMKDSARPVEASTRHYFLRSMNRSKTQSESSRHSTPTTQQRNRMRRAVQSKLDSSLASSSSSGSSLLTTPSSLRSATSGSDVSSSTGHGSIMNDLETVDARQLLKADITDAQLSTIFDLNQSDLHRTKCSMNFL